MERTAGELIPERRGGLSRPARWRIATLAAVHVLIAAHIVHWRLAGRSLSSIQLSDAGRFAAEGVLTTAFIFFAVLLAFTLVFGRFFCAWGCHMLALQEVCRFILGRAGIRPKLIRSRVLWLVPFGAAFHVFVQPAIERIWLDQAFPSPRVELTSEHLWANLPGPSAGIAIALLCGLMMVYFLGSLSFCKYVCPYGAMLFLADRLAMGRIRLTGPCDGCAHCTAACTTGVRVHDEVRRLGAVADSGCMRCFECVSACPNGVLAYRFGRPPVLAGSRAGLIRYDFSVPEEIGAVAAFAASYLALHGLYDGVPLLLSLAGSAITAYMAVLVFRLLRRPFLALRTLTLRKSGRLSANGAVFVAVTLVFAAFLGHSLLIQYHNWRATAELAALGFPRLRALNSPADRTIADRAIAHLTFCRGHGLVDTVDWNMKLAWLYRANGDSARLEERLRRAIALDPAQAAPYFNLGKEMTRQGRREEALQSFGSAVQIDPSLAQFVPAGLDED